MSQSTYPASTTEPWWKFPYVWMVIAGPLIVVVAGFVTYFLAVSNPDPIVDENYYESGLNINERLNKEAYAPAHEARNYNLNPEVLRRKATEAAIGASKEK